jgi:hypothetical protein
MISRQLKFIITTVLAVVLFITNLPLPAEAQTFVDLSKVDRSVLPLQSPPQEPITTLDARDATPPPLFK